jgi:lysozyme family protein
MGKQSGTSTTNKLKSLLVRAYDVNRQRHDLEGMRTSFGSKQDGDDIQSDEKVEPPSDDSKPVTDFEMNVPTLMAPRPKNSRKYDEIADEYVRFFGGADYLNADKEKVAEEYGRKLLQYRARYDEVVKSSKIPWWFVALSHMMESGLNFQTHLHNGDPLTQRTIRVPAGRPVRGSPPFNWIDSARDALDRHKLFDESDWSLPRALYRMEQFNGFGYRRFGIASPYLWSFSTIYSKGKFVADGVFRADAVSKQCGAATVLKYLHQKGEVDLKLDYVGENEGAQAKVFKSDSDAAVANGSMVVDNTPPVDPGFEAFVRQAVPTLRHFQPGEFLVKGGANAKNGLNEPPPPALWPNVVKLVEVLDELRERLGHPIVLNSVYRGEAYNRSVGGASGSQHKKFCAGDFRVIGLGRPVDWASALRTLRAENFFQGGIGVYETFVHVDTRGWPANW